MILNGYVSLLSSETKADREYQKKWGSVEDPEID